MGFLKCIKLTEDEFYEKFNCIKNHFYANPEDCSFDGCMFETYGDEVKFIEAIACGETERKQIWTIIETEGKMFFVSGFHFVNRLGYLLTEEFVPEKTEYEVELDSEVDFDEKGEVTDEDFSDEERESGPFDQLGYEQTSEEE